MTQGRAKSSAPVQAVQSNPVGAVQMKVTNPRQGKSDAPKATSQAQPAQMFSAKHGEGGPRDRK